MEHRFCHLQHFTFLLSLEQNINQLFTRNKKHWNYRGWKYSLSYFQGCYIICIMLYFNVGLRFTIWSFRWWNNGRSFTFYSFIRKPSCNLTMSTSDLYLPPPLFWLVLPWSLFTQMNLHKFISFRATISTLSQNFLALKV